MGSFIKGVLSSVFGTLVAVFFLFVVGAVFLAVSIFSLGEDVELKDNTVLEIKLNGKMVDRAYRHPLESFSLGGFVEHVSLEEVLGCIDAAKRDPKIRGISLEVGSITGGWAQVKAIHDKLLEFSKSGKFILSYADAYSQKAYYLCSVANEIYLNPIGDITFKGLYTVLLFFKKLQDKMGVRYDVVRHGKFKSAVEPFLSDKMSQENRKQIQRLIDQLWSTIIVDISKNRNISREKLNEMARDLLVKYPGRAKEMGFITDTVYHQDYQNLLKDKVGVQNTEQLNRISVKNYNDVLDKKHDYGDEIAVLYAQGEMVEVSRKAYEVGLGEFVTAIREIKRDDDIKALVLRVNSPGGSALVSELIWQELEQLKKEKPLIVSFGDVAASGGYYIACGADRIVASPNTVTGSIGVFGMLLNAEELSRKWGVNAEVVYTHSNAAYPTVFKGASEHKKAEILKDVQRVYQTFIKRVARGRKMSLERVDEIGQGRVWMGTDALKKGLIDSLGNLQDAIDIAAQQVGLEKYEIQHYPKHKSSFERVMDNIYLQVTSQFVRNPIEEGYHGIYQEVMGNMRFGDIQAKAPILYQIR